MQRYRTPVSPWNRENIGVGRQQVGHAAKGRKESDKQASVSVANR